MVADSDADIVQDPPGDWEDISEETGYDYHWHRDPESGDYPSIRIFGGDLYRGYPVEIYPDPREDEDNVWKTRHDTLEEAAERVRELMEEYPHGN